MACKRICGAAAGRPLRRSFYARPTLVVARDLIGMIIATVSGSRLVSGRIVEVEAYLGPEDPASHAARGPTPRSAIMYGPPGVAYVYFIYGMHHCLNVVTEPPGRAGAVLIRALEPLEGRDLMARRRWPRPRSASPVTGGRPARRLQEAGLCNGPGKVCRALGVDLKWNGLALQGRPDGPRRIWLARGRGLVGEIVTTARIGIRQAADRPYRFVAARSDFAK
jgi:DNA-3-methyladenine glycosylase